MTAPVAGGRGWKLGLSFAAGLVLVELYLRFFSPEVSPYWNPLRGMYEADPSTGYRMKPGFSSTVPGAGSWIQIRANARGYRDRDYAVAKPDGTSRILVLGDSATEALQVELEETFHKRLEALLNEEVAGMRWEVPAMALSGAGPSVESLVLEHDGFPMRADIVIAAVFLGNDIDDTCVPVPPEAPRPGARTISYPYYELVGGQPSLVWLPSARLSERERGSFWRHPHRYFYTYYALLTAAKSWAWSRALLARLHPGALAADAIEVARRNPGNWDHAFLGQSVWDGPEGRCWAITREVLRLMKNRAEARGARFLVVLLPRMEQMSEPALRDFLGRTPMALPPRLDLDAPDRQFAEGLEGRGAAAILLGPALRDGEAAEPAYLEYDAHLSPAGHRIVARRIAQELRDRGWLNLGNRL